MSQNAVHIDILLVALPSLLPWRLPVTASVAIPVAVPASCLCFVVAGKVTHCCHGDNTDLSTVLTVRVTAPTFSNVLYYGTSSHAARKSLQLINLKKRLNK